MFREVPLDRLEKLKKDLENKFISRDTKSNRINQLTGYLVCRGIPDLPKVAACHQGSRSRIGVSSALAARVGSKYSRMNTILSYAARRNTTYSWR